MKHSVSLSLILGLFVFLSCGDKKTTTSPETFTASQGTHVGVVRLAYGIAHGHGEMNFEIERFNEHNASWENIAWTKHRYWYDDFSPNGVVPAMEYRYRMRAHTSEGGYGEYTPEVSGYAFKANPVEIVDVLKEPDESITGNHVTIIFHDSNDLSVLLNLESVTYRIYGYYSNYDEYQFSTKRIYPHEFHDGSEYLTIEGYDHHDESTGKYKVEATYRYYYGFEDLLYGEYDVAGELGEPGSGNGGSGGQDAKYGEGVTDINGNQYQTVIIGEQEWMAENLRVTALNDGTPIEENQNVWLAIDFPVYTWYEDDQSNADPYGALYNWHVIESGNACPEGWRVPTDVDWTQLAGYLGGFEIAGGKLKSTQLWDDPNMGATNETGFKALPGGYRYSTGTFSDMGNSGRWWSSDEDDDALVPNLIKGRLMHAFSATLSAVSFEKDEGLSVRCIKD